MMMQIGWLYGDQIFAHMVNNGGLDIDHLVEVSQQTAKCLAWVKNGKTDVYLAIWIPSHDWSSTM